MRVLFVALHFELDTLTSSFFSDDIQRVIFCGFRPAQNEFNNKLQYLWAENMPQPLQLFDNSLHIGNVLYRQLWTFQGRCVVVAFIAVSIKCVAAHWVLSRKRFADLSCVAWKPRRCNCSSKDFFCTMQHNARRLKVDYKMILMINNNHGMCIGFLHVYISVSNIRS